MSRPNTTSRTPARVRRGAAAAILATLAVGCAELPPAEQHGLEAVYLYVDSGDLSRMRNGTFSKTRVPLEVNIDGQELTGQLSYAGRSSLDDLKKSLHIDLGSPHRGRLRYRLNAMSRDPSACRMWLAFGIYEMAGFHTPELEYVTVFLNGEYLGLFVLHETVDEQFFLTRDQRPFGLYTARDGIATMQRGADVSSSFSAKLGATRDLEELVATVNQPPSAANRQMLERLLDVDAVLRYMAVTAFTDHRDGIRNNYILYRTFAEPRFSILPWDLDYTFNSAIAADDGEIFERNAMMRRFFYDEPFYRARYDAYLSEIGQAAPGAALASRIEEIYADIREAYEEDPLLVWNKGAVFELLEHLRERAAPE